jgi:hypothetical protein
MPERNAAIFVDRTDANRVLFFAALAEPQKPLIALACGAILHFVNVGIATMRAVRSSISPTLRFKKLNCRSLIRAGAWKPSDDSSLCLSDFALSFCHASNLAQYDI